MILDSPRIGSEPLLWLEMSKLQEEMNRLVSRAREKRTTDFPAINLWTNHEGAVLAVELPGVEQQDLEISVVGETLTLQGVRKPDQPSQGTNYHRRERGYGRFMRAVQLPFRVEPEEVTAEMRNGILTITLPRAQADRPKKIQVKSL